MSHLPPAVRVAIIADLREDQPYAEICARYKIAKGTVSKIAIKAGLRRGKWRGSLSPDRSAEIVSRYLADEKTEDLAAELGVSTTLILDTLQRAGGLARSCGRVQRPLRHDAFDVLTPDAAYWLGFFFTDGTVHPRETGQPEIALVLQRGDWGHLVKFRDFLSSDHAITPIPPKVVAISGGQGTGEFRYSVRSRQLADRLLALGRYGPVVDPELAASRDFWRGTIDGDGTIGISRGAVSGGAPHIKLFGSHWLLSAFVEFLGPVGARPLNVRPSRTIYTVGASWATAEKIVDRLYMNASTVLDRKAARAAAILAS